MSASTYKEKHFEDFPSLSMSAVWVILFEHSSTCLTFSTDLGYKIEYMLDGGLVKRPSKISVQDDGLTGTFSQTQRKSMEKASGILGSDAFPRVPE